MEEERLKNLLLSSGRAPCPDDSRPPLYSNMANKVHVHVCQQWTLLFTVYMYVQYTCTCTL